MKRNIVATMLLGFLMVSCNTKEIIPEKPDLSTVNYPEIPWSDKTSSSVVLPIEISMNSLLKKINSSIPGKIEFNEAIDCPETPLPREEHCSINGHINIGSVNLTGNGKTLKISTSISGKVTMLIKYRIDIIIGTDGRETDKNLHFAGTINITASPTIDYNWGFKPNIHAKLELSKAYIHFGPKISVRRETKKKLEPLINKELDKIEAQIYSKYNLRKQILPLWKELANPILISENFNVWNVIRPTKIHYNEIDIKNGVLKLGVGIDFDNITYIGEKPTPNPLANIPNLSKSKSEKNNFDLNLPLVVNYDALSKSINNNLPEDEIDMDGVSIALSDIKLFGDASNLYISTHFNAKHKCTKASGILYFKAQPKLENNHLFLEEVDFDIKTKNLLVNSAKWLLKEELIGKIKETAVLNLGKELDNVKAEMNEKLVKVSIKEAGFLNGKINTISVNDLRLSKDGIYIHSNATGEINAKISSLEF